jgi:hypothetical protein
MLRKIKNTTARNSHDSKFENRNSTFRDFVVKQDLF